MTHVNTLVGKTTARLHELGVWQTAGLAFRYVVRLYREYLWRREEVAFDRSYGTETCYRPDDNVLDSAYQSDGNQGYDPTRVCTFNKAVKSLPVDLREFLFVDLGSGKGRAVLLAATFPFRKIMGIEVDPLLHEAATNNLAAARFPSQRCSDIELLCADALKVEINEKKVVYYAFNPFGRSGVQQLMNRIRSGLAGPLAEVYLIYQHPLYREVVDRSGFLDLIYEEQGYDEYTCFCVYTNIKPAAVLRLRTVSLRRSMQAGVRFFAGALRRMLRRKFVVRRISGKGLGVFSTRSYEYGEFIMPIRGRPVPGRTEYSIQIGTDQHIHPRLPLRLLNHSCDPNAGIRYDGRGRSALFARRPIRPGEEITWDYAMSESDFRIHGIEEAFTCRCGAARCRGMVEQGWGGLPEATQLEYEDWCMPYLRIRIPGRPFHSTDSPDPQLRR